MNFGEKIDRICELEGINLKEFSVLTGISYTAARAYRKNRYGLSVSQIDKICNVPRFAQYRNLLLSLDEPIGESVREPATTYTAAKTAKLVDDLEKAGLGEQARDILQILLDAANAKTDK
jgi:transcriptional regulator with XRE-family HTH domain